MKTLSKNFINKLRDEATARPVTQVKLYTKYPGVIRSVVAECYVVNGVVAQTISVYGNAARFFQINDNIIVKSAPLTGIGVVVTTPVFGGTETEFCISTLYLDQSNVGGYVLRDMDFKFTVGAT